MKDNKKKEEGKKKKTWVYVLICVLILIIAFLIWWFLRTFPVTVKYNNGDTDEVLYVRYLNVVKKEDLKENITRSGYTFAGYFETYYLSGEEIEKVKNDSKAGETICKEGFELNSEKTKCVGEKEYDFENTKITEKKTIEALWYVPTDNSSVKITSSANCAIGSNAITLTAKVSGNAKVKEWNVPSCYTDSKVSDKAIKVTRNGNCPNEISSDTVKVTLTNGKTASYTIKYEPKLDVKAYFIYGSTPNTPISPYNGKYEANKITSNIKATFTVNPSSKIVSSTDTSVVLNTNTEITTTIKTACGQSKTITTAAVIN